MLRILTERTVAASHLIPSIPYSRGIMNVFANTTTVHYTELTLPSLLQEFFRNNQARKVTMSLTTTMLLMMKMIVMMMLLVVYR
jgi:hypothetical protein